MEAARKRKYLMHLLTLKFNVNRSGWQWPCRRKLATEKLVCMYKAFAKISFIYFTCCFRKQSEWETLELELEKLFVFLVRQLVSDHEYNRFKIKFYHLFFFICYFWSCLEFVKIVITHDISFIILMSTFYKKNIFLTAQIWIFACHYVEQF